MHAEVVVLRPAADARSRMYCSCPPATALPYYEHLSIDLKLGVGDLDAWLSRGLWPTILTVGCLLCFSGLVYVGRQSRRSVSSALRAVTVSILALSMFFITTVPLTQLHTATRRKVGEGCCVPA